MKKSNTFFLLLLSFILGVGFRSFFAVDFLYVFIAACIAFVLILFIWNTITRAVLLSLIFFALGVGRFEISIPANDFRHIQNYNDSFVELEGIVATEPDVRLDSIKYEIN